MIEFTRLDNEAQILEHDLDAFAASFGHEVTRLYPVWIAHSKGRIISYCHLHPQVIAYPAVKPGLSKREFHELTRRWLQKIKDGCGDPLVIIPEDFHPRIVAKLALKQVKWVYAIKD